jgi:hypothetical protein
MVHGEYSGHDEDDVFDVIDTKRIFWNLQILDIEGSLLERILTKVKLPNLLWLSWKNCPHSSLPSWVPLKNLRSIQVSNGELNTLWHGEAELQLPVFLEDLRADGCAKLKSIQGLAQATKLRSLDVSRCSELEDVPSMETSVSLEQLWMYDAEEL